MPRRTFDDAVVLDIGLRSDLDRRRLAAQDGTVEDAGFGGHAHVAAEQCARGDVRVNGLVNRQGHHLWRYRRRRPGQPPRASPVAIQACTAWSTAKGITLAIQASTARSTAKGITLAIQASTARSTAKGITLAIQAS